MTPGYTIIEHPADVGVEARGDTLEEVFRQAVAGFVGLILESGPVEADTPKTVTLTGTDVENLMVRWLSEFLFLFDTEQFIPSGVQFLSLTPKTLHAVVKGDYLDPARHTVRLDVKAVTYHQLCVKQEKNGFLARVFFDI